MEDVRQQGGGWDKRTQAGSVLRQNVGANWSLMAMKNVSASAHPTWQRYSSNETSELGGGCLCPECLWSIARGYKRQLLTPQDFSSL